MSNKYTTIVKVKKHKLDEIINKLNIQNKLIEEAKHKEKDIRAVLAETNMPKKGNYVDMIKIQHVKKAYDYELTVVHDEIFKLKKDKDIIENIFNKQNLEYEKVKYLADEEDRKRKIEIIKKEDMEMNEISIMIFNNKKGKKRA